ncbi:MAG: hypothetical protein U0R49_10720 [Fimbriimonadales bacterium]
MRIWSALLILAFGAVVLAGCGGGDTAEDRATKERASRVNTDTKTATGQTIKPAGAE